MSVHYIVDSACDINPSILIPEVSFISITCTYKDTILADDFGQTVSHKEFYDAIRQGEVCKTSQINVQTYFDRFLEILNQGKEVVYFGFTSGISGSMASAFLAKNMILELMPDAKLTVIDTLCVSLGYGLMVYKVIDMIKQGKQKDEIINWIETNKLNINHVFTVEDLIYLKRGGRISALAAAMGGMLDIKPVLHVDQEGKLIPFKKARGRKKSLQALVDTMKDRGSDLANQTIYISHGDSIDDANKLKEMIAEQLGCNDFVITYIGSTVGSHSGPGTIALFFLGKNRETFRLV